MDAKITNDDASMKKLHRDKASKMNKENAAQSQSEEIEMPEENESAPPAKSTKSKVKKEAPAPESKNESGIPVDIMESIYNRKVEQLQLQFESERSQTAQKFKEMEERHESQLETLQEQSEQELERARTEKENAFNLLRSFGNVSDGQYVPGFALEKTNPNLSAGTPALHVYGSSEGKKAFKDMERILSESPTAYSLSGGERILTKDYRSANRFFIKNSEAVLSGLEYEMKRKGFLQGNSFTSVKEAPTSPGSIPYAFLETLSKAVERKSHSPRFCFHNILLSGVQIGVDVGTTIKVPRNEHLNEGTSELDYQLDPAIPIAVTTDPLSGGSVPLEIMEYGRGKNTRAIAIPEFYVATAMEDLLAALTDKLGRSYQYFRDMTVRQHLYRTTRVVYNDNGGVTTVPGDVGAGNKGTMSFNFLSNLYAYMASLQIPAWDENGCYAIFMSPTAFAQLEVDLFQNGRFSDKSGMEQITSMFNKLNMGTSDIIYGYEGKVANFMIFRTNATAVGLPGAEGVNTDTLGVGARTVRSSLACGFGTIINRVVSPFEITTDPSTDYGRMIKSIWRSIEGYAAADVDPASNPPMSANQQLRVIEVRTTDVEV